MFSLRCDTNRLHPLLMACSASMACASVQSKDTISALQTHSAKANCPWHQDGPPVMNHVPEVNSIGAGAPVGQVLVK